MGVDLVVETWVTSSNIDRNTVLTPAEFKKRLETLLHITDVDELQEFLMDAGVNTSSRPDQDRDKHAGLLRESVSILLCKGYEELHLATNYAYANSHRYVRSTSIGGISVWCSGGLSEGDDPWQGFGPLRKLLNASKFIRGISNLTPWIIIQSYNSEYEDTNEPRAVGFVTAHPASIMKHAAMTHPDPDVRASIVQDPALTFSANELALLAQDGNTDVTRAVSKRVMVAAIGNKPK